MREGGGVDFVGVVLFGRWRGFGWWVEFKFGGKGWIFIGGDVWFVCVGLFFF